VLLGRTDNVRVRRNRIKRRKSSSVCELPHEVQRCTVNFTSTCPATQPRKSWADKNLAREHVRGIALTRGMKRECELGVR
jgi:hypothetical protein